jgi:hypothetical protein
MSTHTDHGHGHPVAHGTDTGAAFAGLLFGIVFIGAILWGIVIWTNASFASHKAGAAPAAQTH